MNKIVRFERPAKESRSFFIQFHVEGTDALITDTCIFTVPAETTERRFFHVLSTVVSGINLPKERADWQETLDDAMTNAAVQMGGTWDSVIIAGVINVIHDGKRAVYQSTL